MTLIEQIKADRHHSRRNPNIDEWAVDVDGPAPGWVEVTGPAFRISAPTTATDLNGQDYTDRRKDARRIARVPAMEAALLAADELANAVNHEINLAVQDMGAQMDAADRTAQALAAYRAATETPQ